MKNQIQKNLAELYNKYVDLRSLEEYNPIDEVIRVLTRINKYTNIIVGDAETLNFFKDNTISDDAPHFGVNDEDADYSLWFSNYKRSENMEEISIRDLEILFFKGIDEEKLKESYVETKRNEYVELSNKANAINAELKEFYMEEFKRLSGKVNPMTIDIEEFPYSYINKYDNNVNVAVIGVFEGRGDVYFICYTDEDEIVVLDQYTLELNFEDFASIYDMLCGVEDLITCLNESLIHKFLYLYTNYKLSEDESFEVKFQNGTYRLPLDLEVKEKPLYTYIKRTFAYK